MDGQRYRVLISDKARQMMKAHVSFLAEVNPQAAEKLRVSLMEGIRSLAQMPERCPYLDEEDRRSPYRKLHIPKWYLCCFSKRMRKVFRKNEKSMLQNCNKKAKRKGRLQRVKKPM